MKAMHQPSKKDMLKDLAEAGSKGDRSEFVGSWFRYRNNGAGGPGGRHVSPAEAEIVEV